ncbi:MAG: porin [Candidatus Puniceispirillales bacterium]
MRKLLLSTTALAAAATLSANAALADVDVSGYYEWSYSSVGSDIAANDGTSFGQDSEIKISFTNKTDSGLTVGMVSEFEVDKASNGVSDDNYMYISGGFGKLTLGELDGVTDQYGISASDLPAEEIYTGEPADMITENADAGSAGGEANKVSYHIPAVGGLTGGISFMNSGVDGDADATEYALSYAMDAGGAGVTIAAVTGTADVAGAQDADHQVIGASITSGAMTFNLSQATYEDADQNEETNGAAAKFALGNGMTIVGYTTKTEDDTSAEEYTVSGLELQYSIASGLTAYVDIEDYDYKVGTSGNTADAGTASKLTIKASF